MRRFWIALLFSGAVAFGQMSPEPGESGSISGMVRDAATGAPIPEVSIRVLISGTEITTESDSQGHYFLSEVPPGQHRLLLMSRDRYGTRGVKTVRLRPGQVLDEFDFLLEAPGVITGRVVDQNNEPVPGATVTLLKGEYSLGQIAYFSQAAARTDDRGEYTLHSALVGHPQWVLAERSTQFPAISDTPDNPKLRKPAYVPTFYPNSDVVEGSLPLVLRAGERRENVDIQMLRTASYCVSGTVESMAGPVTGTFLVVGSQFRWGRTFSGGSSGLPPYGTTEPDGRFRVCSLSPGNYQMMAALPAHELNRPEAFGTAEVLVSDRDVEGIRIVALRAPTTPGIVIWDGEPPKELIEGQVMLVAVAGNRSAFGSSTSVRSPFGEQFVLENLFVGAYEIRPYISSPEVYVKDVTYAGLSVLGSPVQIGGAIGNPELRVVVARDGGQIEVHVTDEENKPVQNAGLAIFPKDVLSESKLAAKMVAGQADQEGCYTSGRLAPGDYRVIALHFDITPGIDVVHALWLAREDAETVELNANATQTVNVEVLK